MILVATPEASLARQYWATLCNVIILLPHQARTTALLGNEWDPLQVSAITPTQVTRNVWREVTLLTPIVGHSGESWEGEVSGGGDPGQVELAVYE